jgi:hypothetical protein
MIRIGLEVPPLPKRIDTRDWVTSGFPKSGGVASR